MCDPIEQFCWNVYEETRQFYDNIAPHHGGLGYQILYGPPLRTPPVLFVGYQPGGGISDYENELAKGSQERWPAICEYATGPWKLAERLRKMFGRAFLERCVGINAIFVRSPKIEIYRPTVPSNIRKAIEDFCLPRVKKIIELTQPKTVVAIGFATTDLLGGGTAVLLDARGHPLTKVGKIASRPLIGTVHLSGYRISNARPVSDGSESGFPLRPDRQSVGG